MKVLYVRVDDNLHRLVRVQACIEDSEIGELCEKAVRSYLAQHMDSKLMVAALEQSSTRDGES